jgi:hypothetical protein
MIAGQSQQASFLEALTNVAAGYGTALLVQAVAYPQFGIIASFKEDAVIAAIFTLISLARSFWCAESSTIAHVDDLSGRAGEHART